jgi:hypothetical protein
MASRHTRKLIQRLSDRRPPPEPPRSTPDWGFWIEYLHSANGRRCQFGTTRPLTVDETIRFAKGLLAIVDLMGDDSVSVAAEPEASEVAPDSTAGENG